MHGKEKRRGPERKRQEEGGRERDPLWVFWFCKSHSVSKESSFLT